MLDQTEILKSFEPYYNVERPRASLPSFLNADDNRRCLVFRDYAAGWNAALAAAKGVVEELKPPQFSGFCHSSPQAGINDPTTGVVD